MARDYTKADFWTKKALGEGYPARSVWKLQEIDQKFRILPRNGGVVLDLGSSPGSWTLFVLRNTTSRVVSCDLNDLKIDKGEWQERLTFIKGDMSTDVIVTMITQHGQFDAVICDAAPLTSGIRAVDTARSESLVDMAMVYADNVKPGGSLIVKIFQGGQQQRYIKDLQKRFKVAQGYKPKACRAGSFEMYLIAIGKLP